MDRIYDSELKTMELVWANEPVSAKEVSALAEREIGWVKNTTYTVLTKLVDKGYLKREDPGFICSSLVSREEIQRREANGLLQKLFHGSKRAMFSALLEDEELSAEDIAALREMIEKR